MNKIDNVMKPLLLPLIDAYRQEFPFAEVVPISALKGDNVDTLFDLPSLEGVEEVVISKEVVEGTARPLYIYRARAGDASAS